MQNKGDGVSEGSVYSSVSQSMIRESIPITRPLRSIVDTEPAILMSDSNRETSGLISSNVNITGPRIEINLPIPTTMLNIEAESGQVLELDLEEQTIRTMNERFQEIQQLFGNAPNPLQLIDALKQLYSKCCLYLFRSRHNNQHLQSYTNLSIRSLILSAKVSTSVGHYKESLKKLECLESQFIIYDPLLKGQIMLEIAKTNLQLQQYEKANMNFYRVLIHYESLGWKLEIALVLRYIAKLYCILKRNEEAKRLAYEALYIMKTHLSLNDERLAELYLIIAQIYDSDQKMDMAINFIEQAMNIKIKKYGAKLHVKLLETYSLLGFVYTNHQSYQPALDAYKLAMNCQESHTVAKAQILVNMGVIYAAMNRLDKTKKCFDFADAIYTIYLPPSDNLRQRLELNRTQLIQ